MRSQHCSRHHDSQSVRLLHHLYENAVGRVRMTKSLTSTFEDMKHTQHICVALTQG
jgi:hypothetical protein